MERDIGEKMKGEGDGRSMRVMFFLKQKTEYEIEYGIVFFFSSRRRHTRSSTVSEMSFPCTRHVDFQKARKWDFEPKKGVQLPLENDPGSDRGSQRRVQINQKSLWESPGRPDGHPASPKHPKVHPRRLFCLQKTSSDIILPPIWNMF